MSVYEAFGLSPELPMGPVRFLCCGRTVKTVEEREAHRQVNMLGRQTCRRVWGRRWGRRIRWTKQRSWVTFSPKRKAVLS